MPIATTVAFPVANILPADLKQFSSGCFHRMVETCLWAIIWVLKVLGDFLTKLYMHMKSPGPTVVKHHNALSAICAGVPEWKWPR